MSLTITADTLFATTSKALKESRDWLKSSHFREREITIEVPLDEKDLKDLLAAAEKVGDSKVARAVESITASIRGEFTKPIPNFKAFKAALESYLKKDATDGWVYVRQADGNVLPELVTHIDFDSGESRMRGPANPIVRLRTISYSFDHEGGERYAIKPTSNVHAFSPADVTRKRIADALAGKNIFKETKQLRAEFDAALERHRGLAKDGFARQFRFTGRLLQAEQDGWRRRGEKAENLKVIWDLDEEDFRAFEQHHDCPILKDGIGEVPEHPHVRVYDLGAHEFLWINSSFLTPYVYDNTLKDKLILPETHRDLLDILTHDLEAFTHDIIEGKTAGNAILCKGAPGLGKTLSAEVYAEIIERPLIKMHSGELGTTPEEIQRSLETFFRAGKRWNAVLLLDECDVFVMKRGNDVEQNAIVAEFLRALEYFDGLMFMTTNRPDDIDEAIMDRCIAIIDYELPERKRLRKIWQVQSNQFGAGLTQASIDTLVGLIPEIKPRDVKMLLSITLRVAKARKRKPTVDDFRQCAIFRGLKLAESKAS